MEVPGRAGEQGQIVVEAYATRLGEKERPCEERRPETTDSEIEQMRGKRLGNVHVEEFGERVDRLIEWLGKQRDLIGEVQLLLLGRQLQQIELRVEGQPQPEPIADPARERRAQDGVRQRGRKQAD